MLLRRVRLYHVPTSRLTLNLPCGMLTLEPQLDVDLPETTDMHTTTVNTGNGYVTTICIHVDMYIFIYVHMYVCTYVYMYVCMYVCMYICRYVDVCICGYVFMYFCTYVFMYLCIYVFMYVCVYVDM